MKTIFGDWPKAANGVLTLQLSKYALVAGTTQNAPRFYRIRLDANGAVSTTQQMWANDQLMPEGTLYQATITDMNGFVVLGPQMVSVCGPDPLDLNQLLPFSRAVAPPPPDAGVTVTINPGSGSLAPDETLQMTATVTGTDNQAVTWCVSSGSITPGGLYTAPSPDDVPSATTVTIMAISVADPSRSAKVTIAIHPPTVISVTVAPATVTLNANATQQFSATVTNTLNIAVTWTASQGTITAAGLYTAPNVPAITSVTVTATSQADLTKHAQALVTVDPLPVIGVSITPTTVTLSSLQTQQFTATVTNTTNHNVTWTASSGTITTTGLYTAGTVASATTVTITATSVADTSRKAQVSITVNPAASISVTITPTSATLTSGGTQTFIATVSNTSNTAVTWTASSGTITTAGLYTAPTVTASTSVTITATSQADTTKKASVSVTVNPVISVTVSPTSGSIQAAHTLQFSATVSGTTNQSVTWTATPGSISTSGLYTAPPTVSAATTATITATSVANTTKHASVTINIQPPTPAQIDLLQWCVLSNRANQHLVGDPSAPYEASWLDTDAGYPANYPKNTLWWIKNKQGNPWDVCKYDANTISHWITEDGDAADQAACQAANGTSCWMYARAYKRKLIPQATLPRHFTPGSTITLDTQAPNAGNRTTNCESTFTVVNLGPSRCITTGPFKISWGGSIDKGKGTLPDGPNYDSVNGVDTIKNSYQFSGSFTGGFSDVEETYYVQGVGRVAWYNYHAGVFKQKTVNTTLASGGHAVPNFPCGPGKPWFV